jgi:hypothetical protein
MTHAWCRDFVRDIAVRAAEDGRDGPLPTLEEAIGMISKTVSASSPVDHENKGEGMATNGMRTERVTLEITRPAIANYPAPARQFMWQHLLRNVVQGDRESVRVVEEIHFDDLAQVAMERDAAIREREELKQQVKKALANSDKMWSACLAVGGERDKLQARVAELESQLESVACRAATAETALESAQAASGGGEWLCARTAPPPLGHYKLCRWVTTVCGNRQVSYGEGARRADGMWGRANQVEMIPPEQWQHLPAGPSVGREQWERESASGGGVITDMTDILRRDIADADEKHAAMATLVEAVCPGWALTQAASGGGGSK